MMKGSKAGAFVVNHIGEDHVLGEGSRSHFVTLDDIKGVDGFSAMPHAEKIKLFLCWLHTHDGKERVAAKDVSACYEAPSLAPTNVHSMLSWMKGRRQALKNKAGYRLEMKISDELTALYGQRDATIQVPRILNDLPARLGKLKQRAYLDETLICFRHKVRIKIGVRAVGWIESEVRTWIAMLIAESRARVTHSA